LRETGIVLILTSVERTPCPLIKKNSGRRSGLLWKRRFRPFACLRVKECLLAEKI
jgi:hypothetical protein